MKANTLLNIIFSLFGVFGCVKTFAQDKPTTKETQEITIRKDGKKETKVTIEINGNSITVNGKPLAEFKEDGITIMNRKMILRDGDKITMMLDDDNLKELESLGNGISSDINIEKMDLGNSFSQSFSTERKVYLGVMTNGDNKDGAIVNNVIKESPAAEAGIQNNDIIYKIDEEKITNPATLSTYIAGKKAGDKVKVYFLRDGLKKDATATLANRKGLPNKDVRVFKYKMPGGNSKSFSMPDMENMDMEGVHLDHMGEFPFSNKPKLGIKIQDTEAANGVKILDVEKASSGDVAGLKNDDIIIGIADKKINNTDEAREALNDNKDKSSYSMKVKRSGTEMNVIIKIAKKLKTANL